MAIGGFMAMRGGLAGGGKRRWRVVKVTTGAAGEERR
jgi:hypothetical protein